MGRRREWIRAKGADPGEYGTSVWPRFQSPTRPCRSQTSTNRSATALACDARPVLRDAVTRAGPDDVGAPAR
jgi:hypothetical protein